jgi:hypothetical protein
MAKLTSSKRSSLPKSSFVFPSTRKFPIHDKAHAANALARAANKSPAVKAKVHAAVCRRYPSLPSCK